MQKYLSFTITLCYFFIGINSFVYAQQADTLKSELAPIKVHAIYSTISPANMPLSLSVVSRPAARRRADASLTLDDITAQLPGIWVNNRENYSLGERITIRGMGWRSSFGVRGLQVILDGIPLTVADGQAMLNPVDPAFVQKIELIRGPAATFWGNSSGGVLYLSTFSDADAAPTLGLRSSLGSYGLAKQDVRYNQSFGRHKISAYTSYLSQNGYRDHSAVKVSRTGLKGTVDINSKSRLEYVGAFVAMPEAQNPSSLTAVQAAQNPTQANQASVKSGAGKQVYQGQLGLNYYRDAAAGFITLTGYGIYRDLTNPLPYAIIDLNRWAGGLRGTLERSFNKLDVNVGFDTKLQRDNRTEFENDNAKRGQVDLKQLEKVTNQALFATSKLSVGRWNFLAGVRFDWLTFSVDSVSSSNSPSRTFHALSPSIGLSYKTERANKWYANLGTSFEAPTTTELVNSPEGGNGFNPELKPEHTLSLELGTRGRAAGSSITYDVALYRMWISDILFPYQLQANGPTFYRNHGATAHSGIETMVSVKPSRSLELDATYTITHAVFKNDNPGSGGSVKGNRVPGIPAHRLNLRLQYQIKHFLGELSYHFVSGYYADNLNTAKNDSYATVDAKLSLTNPLKSMSFHVQPYLNVNNIFDVNYNGSIVPNAFGNRYFEPAAGRNFQVGLSVTFP